MISALVALGAVLVLGYVMITGARSFAAVAALVLVGVVAFTGFVSALSVTAERLGMLDARHPFGLPEGSIRAILTFAFIVLVGVFASYLLVQTSRTGFVAPSEPFLLPVTTLAEARVLQAQLAGEGLVVVSGTVEPIRATFIPRTDYRLADDVAKQILTMLSTMLAAMIGFYFGSRPNEQPIDPHLAERRRVRAELDGLKITAPTLDEVKRAAAEMPEDQLTDEQKQALGNIRARLDTVAAAFDTALKTAEDPAAPIDAVRTTRAAAGQAQATLAAELKAIEEMKPRP
ncbi:hypothetical protein [Phreatobacter cathodiphilus]|uniref:hypothetical protein n=1 Tax=Phreatobacter cathodiphilus TaxID=1868589 RepID=UPI0011B294B6|nr:hypothetical protein [Phreatobacter cathodiphilus]